MKTLYVIRHAKAVAHDAAPTDFERALARRGHSDAARIASRIALVCPAPDVMLVSTALRTSETARYFIEAWNLGAGTVQREPRVYDAPLHVLMELVEELPDGAASAAIVGHNPGVTDLVSYLTSGRSGDLSTCAVAVIEMPAAASWDEVAAGTGRLRATYEP